MSPRFNRRRAMFVLTKIDEILAWEQKRDTERDTKFVELGHFLCEVRAGQYWRLGDMKSFDQFLEKKFPESRRKAYYLMSIHEYLPPQARKELKKVGWAKGIELAKLARRDRQDSIVQPGCTRPKNYRKRNFSRRWNENLRENSRALGNRLFQALQEPDPGG